MDRDSSEPLWAQVHHDLRRRLDAGAFLTSFPGEMALVAQYGVSRQTVRQTLRQLRELGTVTAERGRPPRVAAPTEIEQPLGALYSLFASVEAADRTQRRASIGDPRRRGRRVEDGAGGVDSAAAPVPSLSCWSS